jgi:hypothetical protein
MGKASAMAIWIKTEDEVTEFVYRLFHSGDGVTIDLDDALLQELVELFVGAQLGFWRQINALAQTRFPDRPVSPNEIQTVREFIENRQEEFVRLFAEHIPHYLMLTCRPTDFNPCTQKKPHRKPSDHYCDHLAAWKTPIDTYQIMISETKASELRPRDLVRQSAAGSDPKGTMFDEFDEIERGKLDLDLKHQLLDLDWSSLIADREEMERLVEAGFWKKDYTYHGCVVTSNSKSSPSIFKDYNEVAAKTPDSPNRRWATVVPISKWEEWVDKISAMALDFLDEREREGHF